MIVLEDDKIKDLSFLKTITQYRIYLIMLKHLCCSIQHISCELKLSDKKVEESCKLLIEKDLISRYKTKDGQIILLLKSNFDSDEECEKCVHCEKSSMEKTYVINCKRQGKECIYSYFRKLKNIKRVVLKRDGAVKCDYESIIKGRFGVGGKTTSEWNEKDFVRFLMKQFVIRNENYTLDRKQAIEVIRFCKTFFKGKCGGKWRNILKAFILDRITNRPRYYAIQDMKSFDCMFMFLKQNYHKFELAFMCSKYEINCTYSLGNNNCHLNHGCGEQLRDYMKEKYN